MAEARRKFDQDFREGAVRLVRETGKPIAQVARDRKGDPFSAVVGGCVRQLPLCQPVLAGSTMKSQGGLSIHALGAWPSIDRATVQPYTVWQSSAHHRVRWW